MTQKYRFACTVYVVFITVTALADGVAQQPLTADTPTARELATTPAPQGENGVPSEWWLMRHNKKMALRDPGVELVLIGDSITHGWEDPGKAVWQEHFGDMHSLNLGYSADRTEHVLWRLEHGEVEGLSPKLAVVMIGTNNTGHRMDPPEAIAAGVEAILAELEERLPETSVLLLAIFPRAAEPIDPMRVNNRETNRLLAELAAERRVQFADINEAFLADDGELPLDVMPDLLHPNAAGYEIWARQLEPWFERYLGAQ